MTLRHIDVNKTFNGDLTDEQVTAMYHSYQPIGSGSSNMMRTVCELLEVIAKDRGIELEEPKGVKK